MNSNEKDYIYLTKNLKLIYLNFNEKLRGLLDLLATVIYALNNILS